MMQHTRQSQKTSTPDTSPWTQVYELFCEAQAEAGDSAPMSEEQAPTYEALADVYNRE